ncbi:Gfo/Idh/MocA family protein [Micromonospora sp. CA-263727]|uniref:Gfo/Idh/MocA family protein n=1 Tax=Micromonospora sp. CA-263727 TaxID=3239967 RepID=UPI003D929800
MSAPDGPAARRLGIGVIGVGWMGRVHTTSHLRVRHHYPELPVEPALVAVADPEPGRAEAAARQYHFRRFTTDWRDLLDDPDVQAVSVTAPNFLHREIGVAVAEAGKHLWIEKPVGLTAADAQAVAAAVAGAGVQCTVGFNYRNAPAVTAARALIQRGGLGAITHARFRLFSDYAAHPQGALSWRFERGRGGNGVLGDLASHGVDLARYLLGEIDALIGETAVVIPQRPQPTGAGSHFDLAVGGELGAVENEDYVSCLLRFANGARGVLEASRVSVGDQNNYGFEIHGTKGLVSWDFRRMGELAVSVGDAGAAYQNQSVDTAYVGPGDGDFAAFQPGAGIAMGYDDLKVIEAARFLRSIAEGTAHGVTIDDAVRSAQALDAITESVRTGGWVGVAR